MSALDGLESVDDFHGDMEQLSKCARVRAAGAGLGHRPAGAELCLPWEPWHGEREGWWEIHISAALQHLLLTLFTAG